MLIKFASANITDGDAVVEILISVHISHAFTSALSE
jgi:hypothetical protein